MNCPKCHRDFCPGWDHVRYCTKESQHEYPTPPSPPGAPIPPKGDPRFRAVLEELAILHELKGADYGTDYENHRASTAWGTPAWQSPARRIGEKLSRLQRFARDGKVALDSPVQDLNDSAILAIIARILLEEETVPKVSK